MEDLLTLAQTAAATGLSLRTLFRRRESGKFPADVHIGPHNVMLKRSEVDAWIKANPKAPRAHRDP